MEGDPRAWPLVCPLPRLAASPRTVCPISSDSGPAKAERKSRTRSSKGPTIDCPGLRQPRALCVAGSSNGRDALRRQGPERSRGSQEPRGRRLRLRVALTRDGEPGCDSCSASSALRALCTTHLETPASRAMARSLGLLPPFRSRALRRWAIRSVFSLGSRLRGFIFRLRPCLAHSTSRCLY